MASFAFHFGEEELPSPLKHESINNTIAVPTKEVVIDLTLLSSQLQRGIASTSCKHITVAGEKFCQFEPQISEIRKEKGGDILASIAEDDKMDVLRPGGVSIYEGGLKLWECSIDLVTHLCQGDSTVFERGHKVLEVGCGFGLPGIVALRNGASVCFQDLNASVLSSTTAVHVVLNCPKISTENSQNISFISGDWKCEKLHEFFKKETDELGFDVILTAETLYTKDSAILLSRLLYMHLRKETGRALVATKRYYFGLGGGTSSFCEQLKNCGPILYKNQWMMIVPEYVAAFEDCASNIRDVLECKWRICHKDGSLK